MPGDPVRQGIVIASLAGQIMASPDAAFVVAEWADEGGVFNSPRLMAPVHVHHRDDEAWYVLEGVLRFQLGDREVEARAGSGVFAPRGVPHTFWNPGPGPVRYLLIMTPNTLRLIEELHATRPRDPEAMRAVYRKYGAELLA